MDIIPLIRIYKRKIVNSNYNDFENFKILLQKYKDEYIYIFDHDGINKNRPNLCIFQKLSKNHDLWVDSGPRVFGDIVDSIVAGASKITVRKNFVINADTLSINEILENEIYMNIDKKFFQSSNNDLIKKNVNGFVILNDEKTSNYDFKDNSDIRNIVNNNNSYAYLSSKEDIHYINKFDFKGLLVDIEKISEFERIGI